MVNVDLQGTIQEDWHRLVRKLSTKRKKRKEKKRETKELDHDEDDIPDDWQPDFIPKTENNYANQPDVVPACSSDEHLNDADKIADEEAMNAIIRYRSNKRSTMKVVKNYLNTFSFNFQEISTETNA